MNISEYLRHIPRVDLGLFPTPLHRLNRLEQSLHHHGIYIKRDDLNGIGSGGNKIRSLEFLLAEAQTEQCDMILVSGPLQSNLCCLTAAACSKLGLPCTIVLNGKRPDILTGNLLLNSLLGADIHYLGSVSQHQRAMTVEALYADAVSRGFHPYIIQNGASTGCGALGYVKAVQEIVEQCETLQLEGLTIYVPAGNGGVASGLVLGNYLAGLPFHIVVVSVEYDAEDTCTHINQIMAESAQLLGVSPPSNLNDVCRVTDEFRGDGWGHNTPASEQEVFRLARMEGILSENIYNSKVLVGMETEIRRGNVTGNVCFLHTGGIGSLYAQYC